MNEELILMVVLVTQIVLVYLKLSNIEKVLTKSLAGITEWKKWDKAHHLEEVESKKLLQEIVTNHGNS